MDSTLLHLYNSFSIISFDGQVNLADFLEENASGQNWNYDVPSASLTFGEDIVMDAYYLGSFSQPEDTWLWAWSNPHLHLSAENIRIGEYVRQLTEKTGSSFFAEESQIPVASLLPEELLTMVPYVVGNIIVGSLDFDAYYLAPYEHGAGVLVIRDERLRVPPEVLSARAIRIIMQTLSEMDVFDHKTAVMTYIKHIGWEPIDQGNQVTVKDTNLVFDFDELNRLTKMDGSIKAN